MSKIFKCLAAIVIAAMLIIIGVLLWEGIFARPDIPKLTSNALDIGTVTEKEELKDTYEVYSATLKSEEFIDNKVNQLVYDAIDNFKKENDTDKNVASAHIAIFKNIIDTYKVNDDIVGVKVTIVQKNIGKGGFTKTEYGLNFNLSGQKQITLDDIFRDGYKDEIKEFYTDNHLLRKNTVEFYGLDDKYVWDVSYKKLKNYLKTKYLTAQNFGMKEEEFKDLELKIVDPSKKLVAVTFDDGPRDANTEKILEILDNHNARATFFMLGENVVRYKDVVKKVYENGHEIGIHTWDHPQLTKLSDEEIKKQVSDTEKEIVDITGYKPSIVRPPYGSINDNVKNALSDYDLILWSIDSLDWKSRDENQIVPLVMNNVQDGDIILLHDIHTTTTPAVERIVTSLQEQGYQLVTVSELLDAKGYDRANLQVFNSGRQ